MKRCPVCGAPPSIDFPPHGGTVIGCVKCIFQDGSEVMVSARVEPRRGQSPLARIMLEQRFAQAVWNGLHVKETA